MIKIGLKSGIPSDTSERSESDLIPGPGCVNDQGGTRGESASNLNLKKAYDKPRLEKRSIRTLAKEAEKTAVEVVVD